MTTPSMGWASQFGIGAANLVTERYEAVSCAVGKNVTHLETQGLRGSRSHIAENVSEGTHTVGGSVVLRPNVAALQNLLPRILGGMPSGNNYPLADVLPSFFLAVDKVGAPYLYDGCKVNKAIFRSSKGRQLELELDIQGKTETSTAFPALALSTGQPFTHQEAVLTISGASRQVDNIALTIDNGLILDRFFNSRSRTDLPESDRTVMLTCETPFTSAEVSALYNQSVTPLAGSLVYTNGTSVLTFSFAALQVPTRPPVIHGPREIMLPLQLVARRSGSTLEIVTSLAA